MAKFSGKASTVKIGTTIVALTKWTPKVNRELADTTDSSNYDATSDMLQPSQIPVKVMTELAVEGWYDLTATTPAFLTAAYGGAGPLAVDLKLNATTWFGYGAFDISDFEADVPVDDTVSFKATLKSNGVFVTGIARPTGP